MVKHKHKTNKGFTLIELMVAAAIGVLVIGGATAALINGIRSWRAESIRSELHMDLEIALERIRTDLRLSSIGIGLMAFFPASASEFTAISFPLATPGGDDLLPRDGGGKIVWDTTVIYHVRPGTPDELIRTIFSPRNQDASAADFYAQLVQTVQAANFAEVQAAVLDGETAQSRIIFRNLVNLAFRPANMSFDGYAPTYERARRINWGSVVLGDGVHDLTFTVQRKNPLSSGYNIGIDRFALSYSGSAREGEIFLPIHTHPAPPYYYHEISGGSVFAQDMSTHGASWSGNCQLTYVPDYESSGPAGSRLTFRVANDLWCDANFDNPPGVLASNCSRKVDHAFVAQQPHIPDIVVSMDAGISWSAENVTDGVQHSTQVTTITNVNILHGSGGDLPTIRLNGAWARFSFMAGTNHNLYVYNARVAQQQAGNIAVPGTERQLFFGGNLHRTANKNQEIWTDWIRYEIDRDKSYLLKWERRDTGGADPPGITDARVWINNGTDASGNPYVLSYLDGEPDNRQIALASMEVRFPSNAVYRSGVFDTRIDSPTYRRLTWTQVEPWPEGDIDIRVRSANSSDMSDACAWFPPGYFQNNLNNDISAINGGRYVQYEALFTASGDHIQPAKLRDVTITWEAPTGIVDLVVDFARGPDYGVVTAEVGGQDFVKGIEVDLEIFREGPFGMISVPGIMEVRPLNTGR